MADQAAQIAKSFTEFYYNLFDTNRAQVTPVYAEQAFLCFNDTAVIQGQQQIAQKLSQLPFQQVKHYVRTLDAQPAASGIIVFVTGGIQTDPNSPNQLNFSQVFHLAQAGQSWTITNDMFRLVMG